PLYCCSACERRYERRPGGRAGLEYRLSRPSDARFYRATEGTPEYEQEFREVLRDRLLIELRAAVAQDLTDREASGLAVEVVEPLVDMYWADIAAEFEDLAIRTPALRKAISGSIIQDDAVSERLDALVGPEDQLD